jgi:hypothetical protein
MIDKHKRMMELREMLVPNSLFPTFFSVRSPLSGFGRSRSVQHHHSPYYWEIDHESD